MKYFLFFIFLLSSFSTSQATVHLVDNFSDQNLTEEPKWWSFGNVYVSVEQNQKDNLPYVGNYSMRLEGETTGWYIGGVGTLLGIDTKRYNAIKFLIRGYGPKSGTLSIELYDDDNNNWAIEPHPDNPSVVYKDDKFVNSIPVTWYGWRVVIVELKDFVDDNKNFGDNVFNPYQTDNSGGLMQMQLMLLSSKQDGWAKMDIDSIKFFYYRKPKVKKVVEDDSFF